MNSDPGNQESYKNLVYTYNIQNIFLPYYQEKFIELLQSTLDSTNSSTPFPISILPHIFAQFKFKYEANISLVEALPSYLKEEKDTIEITWKDYQRLCQCRVNDNGKDLEIVRSLLFYCFNPKLKILSRW